MGSPWANNNKDNRITNQQKLGEMWAEINNRLRTSKLQQGQRKVVKSMRGLTKIKIWQRAAITIINSRTAAHQLKMAHASRSERRATKNRLTIDRPSTHESVRSKDRKKQRWRRKRADNAKEPLLNLSKRRSNQDSQSTAASRRRRKDRLGRPRTTSPANQLVSQSERARWTPKS